MSETNNLLLKRGNGKCNNVCQSSFAHAIFSRDITGIMSFGQDDFGCTFVYGYLNGGFSFPEKHHYSIVILDSCGQITHNLNDKINFDFVNDGVAPFFAKLPDSYLNLDCTPTGIFNVQCDPITTPTPTYSKRRSRRAFVGVVKDNRLVDKFPIPKDGN
ncbi:13267_t:CDS:1 [Acaulospora colombiana]|uniref:13267_t:CDS:1 n=1 Tax=Acaulospora colombiana TaxID=27376 RepID=A0ACA9K0N7_9GLOM|nr:13267_t:CDS:1 [Acaulospora colombiana]